MSSTPTPPRVITLDMAPGPDQSVLTAWRMANAATAPQLVTHDVASAPQSATETRQMIDRVDRLMRNFNILTDQHAAEMVCLFGVDRFHLRPAGRKWRIVGAETPLRHASRAACLKWLRRRHGRECRFARDGNVELPLLRLRYA